MKIIVISDSHGRKDKVDKTINSYEYDYLFFLGDGISDLGNLIYANNTKFVRGNCDYFSNHPIYEIVKLNNITILLTHRHTQKVKANLNELIVFAKQVN